MRKLPLRSQGGPAFPFADKYQEHGYQHSQPGMTLLDYFAAAALTGLLANHPFTQSVHGKTKVTSWLDEQNADDAERLAEQAYFIALEMLIARDVSTHIDEETGGEV